MRSRTLGLAGACSLLLAMAFAGPAAATHSHVMSLGNGMCVVIAEDAGEENVELPASVFENNPNVDIAMAAMRMHPLHVLVHQGKPGEGGGLEVYGSAAGNAMCSRGYVNR